jgi:hypothetical protein
MRADRAWNQERGRFPDGSGDDSSTLHCSARPSAGLPFGPDTTRWRRPERVPVPSAVAAAEGSRLLKPFSSVSAIGFMLIHNWLFSDSLFCDAPVIS